MIKNQSNEHIQVFVRCRPLMKSELRLPVPVEVHPDVNKILVRDTGIDKSTVKSFSFDRVFGPEAKQEDIYAQVVAPVIQEVIFGFNCTIFAYGQTGTGKTFTIEGERSLKPDDSSEDSLSGIIPRSMKHLLHDLTGENMKFEICVSFLELYNEEIFDLLSNADDLTKLKIFDNSAQKGSVIVQGLQILPITCMGDVYTILDKGCRKRRKAATLLNKASSRSHTVFTVTVNIKESSSTLEKVKSGKLNLVDLAGSENIGRSGAIHKRAREAGNINQSLLALGRVITSLCDKAAHIPYRESKLTRLLQDSLGGQTKTAVIATISPSAVHVEETLNTLEYALRAKSITNKPELNAQVTVISLTQDYLEEIIRLKKNIYDLGKDKKFYAPHEHIKHWESILSSTIEEKYKLLSEKERLMEENKALENAITAARNAEAEKKNQLETAKIKREELRVQLEKEKQDHKLHEAILQVMEPLSDCLHQKLHKDLEEIEALKSETMKIKDRLNYAVKERRNYRETLQDIGGKRKEWNEKLHHFSNNLMNSIKNTNESVLGMTSECNNYVSVLRNACDSRKVDCENEFANLFKAVNELERINRTFEVNVEISLREEKSTNLKCMQEFKDAYSASSVTSVFQSLNKTFNECKPSLVNVSEILNDWRQDLASEMSIRQKLMNEHLDNQIKAVDSTVNCVNVLLNKLKDTIEAQSSLITGSLNSETANKKLWGETFQRAEKALSSLDTYCTEYIKCGVDTTTQAHSFLKNCSTVGNDITRKLINFCECSLKNVDTIQNKDNFHLQSVFGDKWEEMKMKVDSSCSRYKDLNSELAKCSSMSQNLDGCCSDIEDSLKSKFRTNEQSKVNQCIQERSDSVLKCGDIYKKFLSENQIKVNKSLTKDKIKSDKLIESSKELDTTLNSTLCEYIRSLRTDLLKNLTTEAVHNIKSEETNSEATVFELDETMISENCLEHATNQNECPVCANRKPDETLQANGDISLSVIGPNKSQKNQMKPPQASNDVTSSRSPNKSQKNQLKPPQASNDVTSSRSFMSHLNGSPVKRPRNRFAFSARKILQFHDVEKLTDELLGNSSDEVEDKV